MKFNKKILSITQILILVIGILAFSYIVGEIGKKSGVEIGTGVGVVSAQVESEKCESVEISTTECSLDNKQVLECREISGEKIWAEIDNCDYKGQTCLNGNCVEFKTNPSPGSGDLPKKPEKPDYNEGDIISLVNEKGELETYEVKGDDLDENGKAKEGSKLEEWAINAGGSVVSGVVTNAAGNSIKGGAASGTFSSGFISGLPGGENVVVSGSETIGAYAQAIAGPAIAAFLVWALYKYIVKADVRNMRDVKNIVLVTGGAGAITALILVAAGVSGPVGWIAGAIVLVVALIASLFTFKNYSQETITYIVSAWKAKDGGEFCEKCNDLKYGCTEYQCKSFGKGCEIVNTGTTQEKCTWKNPNDILPPKINALLEVLSSTDYSYQPLQVVQGVKIDYSKDSTGKGCIPAYTALTLGIETDEFAECKIDATRTSDYETMAAPMTKLEGFEKTHTLPLPHVATPSVESQQAAGILDTQITNGQSQQFYIRCKDVNGNSNADEFVMEFCVQDGPDTSAPIIIGTNFAGTGFLQYNQTDTNLEVYTNEPAECKWSPDDLSYDSMQFEMTQCSMTEGDYLFAGFGYGCKGTLTGLKDKIENKIYIKCEDKPWWTQTSQGQRYANENSYLLNLMGTEPLIIDKITVNGKSSGAKIKDSTDTIKAKLEVTAKFGAQQGKTRCQYEQGGNFVDFYNEGDIEFVNVNTQNLYLSEGNYNLSIKCSDAGGNSDKGNIEFSIETDREAPIAARAYYDVKNLKIITNEPAECVYTTQSNIECAYEFKDGTAMSEIGELTHYTSWQAGKKYYIKCKDAFGNQPLPGQCSIIVNAFKSY